jgi:hypothetical protein
MPFYLIGASLHRHRVLSGTCKALQRLPRNVRIELYRTIHTQLFGALNHILAVDAAGKSLVLELLAHAGRLYIGNGFGRFDQRARGQKSGKLIAGKEHLVQMCHAGTPE